MNSRRGERLVSIYLFLFASLLLTYAIASAQMVTKAWATIDPATPNVNDPNQISDDLVKDNYLVYIKEKMGQGLGGLS